MCQNMLQLDMAQGTNTLFGRVSSSYRLHIMSVCHVLSNQIAEPGIRRRNKDSHGNENRKLWKKKFSIGKKIDKHTFFL